ncbi:class I SAM-dependent methyltransferase [Muricauda sp. SCSIO 64092]|uniref:class I SAM-dependent methyltransferase n=1 Tax=Allomuricauda sp. SCSIO 64092 TaxID=2908842 RepID=UPI001FF6F2F6|nr:class I SAM-dependent methyltransferase [Muricauda sp. SCSIO 64092]UOY08852.1 class I SAM-dependent methyltransferase [Muricauda sp. SCSIO 64092]
MKSYLKTNDFFLSNEAFELLYDEKLDMLVTSPQPVNIEKYYETDNYISHSDGEGTLLEKVYQRIKKRNLQKKVALIEKYTKDQKTLLDVGAGTGDFLRHAKNKEWKVFGVEPNTNARKLASQKEIDLEEDLVTIRGMKFSVITLWHVLEHLPNLKENIKRLSHMLEEGGTLIVAVPNFKSYDAKSYGRFWAAYDVPRHLWHFSRTAIARLFLKEGMELKKVKPMWFDSFYVSLLSEEYKTGKKNWIKAGLLGLVSNISGMINKEYSSHIYILQKSK